MLYRQKFDTFIHQYGYTGYITNKSGFGDCVAGASGAMFLPILPHTTRSLEEQAAKTAASIAVSSGSADILRRVRTR
jgi:hypothetical protein